MDRMRNFKFIGGPWDGEYHEIDPRRYYVFVREATPLRSFKLESIEEPVLDEEGEPILDEEGEPMMRMIKPEPGPFTRYTRRHMAGEAGNVYWYAPDDWPDIYTLSQFVHHYRDRR